jgi:hypothetical protein
MVIVVIGMAGFVVTGDAGVVEAAGGAPAHFVQTVDVEVM